MYQNSPQYEKYRTIINTVYRGLCNDVYVVKFSQYKQTLRIIEKLESASSKKNQPRKLKKDIETSLTQLRGVKLQLERILAEMVNNTPERLV